MDSEKKKPDRRIVVCVVVAVVIGLWAGGMGGGNGPLPNPFVPSKPDRPVLKFLAKVARLGLWVMVFAEKPPQNHQAQHVRQRSPEELAHAEGW